jgi:hypothetical protein
VGDPGLEPGTSSLSETLGGHSLSDGVASDTEKGLEITQRCVFALTTIGRRWTALPNEMLGEMLGDRLGTPTPATKTAVGRGAICSTRGRRPAPGQARNRRAARRGRDRSRWPRRGRCRRQSQPRATRARSDGRGKPGRGTVAWCTEARGVAYCAQAYGPRPFRKPRQSNRDACSRPNAEACFARAGIARPGVVAVDAVPVIAGPLRGRC